MKDYISVKEASEMLRCTRQEIVRRIWRGFIKAERIGKIYIIPIAEIKKFKRSKGKK